jgi:hypothetical protein
MSGVSSELPDRPIIMWNGSAVIQCCLLQRLVGCCLYLGHELKMLLLTFLNGLKSKDYFF